MAERLTLKGWRGARGFTQEYMADNLGVHVNTYNRWEQCPARIQISKLMKICKILQINVDDIKLQEGEE